MIFPITFQTSEECYKNGQKSSENLAQWLLYLHEPQFTFLSKIHSVNK